MKALICKGSSEQIEAMCAHSFIQRLKGLLGSSSDAGPLLLTPCSAIHTYWMNYPIDVAFLDGSGKVLRTARRVAPGQNLRERGAYYTLERPSSSKPWLSEGEQTLIVYQCATQTKNRSVISKRKKVLSWS